MKLLQNSLSLDRTPKKWANACYPFTPLRICVKSTERPLYEHFVAAIEPRGVRAQEPAHPGDEIGVGRLDDEVKMIAHETIRVNLPIGFGANLGERGEKFVVIKVVAEDGFAAVATVHDVINCARIFDAQRTGHDPTLLSSRVGVNSKERPLSDPFPFPVCR